MYIRLCYLWQQPRVRKVVREFAFWEGRDVTVMSLHGRENSVLEQRMTQRYCVLNWRIFCEVFRSVLTQNNRKYFTEVSCVIKNERFLRHPWSSFDNKYAKVE